MTYPKRLIEVDLPIKRISAHARREKSIRHGHISTLHIWWARRPLAACRAVICASLWPDPADPNCPQTFRDAALKHLLAFAKATQSNAQLSEMCDPGAWQRYMRLAHGLDIDAISLKGQVKLRAYLLDFIADFAAWEASSNHWFLDTARSVTNAAHEGLGGEKDTRPLVIDPFAGGGAIPLEALRVGADAFASDLNPVAVLLNKVVLEYMPKYGETLSEEVRKSGAWIAVEAKAELSSFYPEDADGSVPIAYIWARTILSEAPGQDGPPVEIPLIRSMQLSKKGGRNCVLRWVREPSGSVKTEIVEAKYADGESRMVRRPMLEIVHASSGDRMDKGTSAGGTATCPVSGFTMPVEVVRARLSSRRGGSADARLLAVVTCHAGRTGRTYRVPTKEDADAAARAAAELCVRVKAQSGDLPLVPEGELNHLRGFFNVVLYGMTTWGDVFSPRQLLALTTLSRLVTVVGDRLARSGNAQFAEAVQTCLALAVDKQADSNSSLCAWRPTTEDIGHTFGRQALPMMWDFVEGNIFSGATRDWASAVNGGLQAMSSIDRGLRSGKAEMASATAHPLPNDSADALITDPPYYAAVPYADLSDFFYSWLRRTLRGRHSVLLASALSPKDDECVSLAHRAAMYRNKDREWFERTMTKACDEARRVVKPSGIGVIVFASKDTPAWEAMLQAVVDSGWMVTASWPIDTEMGSRLRAKDSAVLASSVHIVCRPREKAVNANVSAQTGDWRDVLSELPLRIHEWMSRLQDESVVGADAIFACLGPALEIFSRYARVENANGDQVSLRDFLVHVWGTVSQEALAQIFKGVDATGFEEDARLTAMWLWTLNAGAATSDDADPDSDETPEADEEEASSGGGKGGGYVLEFDAARKIAQGLGAHIEDLTSVIEVKGNKARLLSVGERTRRLFGKDDAEAPQPKRKKKDRQMKLFTLEEVESEEGGWGEKNVPQLGNTVLDRVHQSMILFAAGRGEALRRFLVEDGAGRDQRFWKLAQALSALYPQGTDEKRWVDGVLARKKGLGL